MRIDIELDDRAARASLQRLIRAGTDLTPAMRAIGEHLLNTTRERFRDERAPDGTPWAPLSERTRERKSRNADRILTERGHLQGTLSYRAGRRLIEIGSTRIHAGTHQFGAARGAFGTTGRGQPIPFGDIPARPFLGVSAEDRTEINLAVQDFLAKVLARRP